MGETTALGFYYNSFTNQWNKINEEIFLSLVIIFIKK